MSEAKSKPKNAGFLSRAFDVAALFTVMGAMAVPLLALDCKGIEHSFKPGKPDFVHTLATDFKDGTVRREASAGALGGFTLALGSISIIGARKYFRGNGPKPPSP